MKGLSFQISTHQIDFLIEHCKGPRLTAIIEGATVGALMARGLLRIETRLDDVNRKEYTVLTERGREVVCVIVGNMIDSLVNANALKERPPFEAESYKRELVQAFL